MASTDRADTGRRGERDAAAFLKRAGYRILARNYRCPLGELDIVAVRNRVISFIEVKSSENPAVNPEDAVNHHKQHKLAQVAGYFVHTHHLSAAPCQFDVVAVFYDDRGQPHITHYPDAFQPA